jgi:hypothetical protein
MVARRELRAARHASIQLARHIEPPTPPHVISHLVDQRKGTPQACRYPNNRHRRGLRVDDEGLEPRTCSNPVVA